MVKQRPIGPPDEVERSRASAPGPEPIASVERFSAPGSANESRASTSSASLWIWRSIAAGAMVVAAALTGLTISRSGDVASRDNQIAALRREREQLDAQLATAYKNALDMRAELVSRSRLTNVLLAADARLFRLGSVASSSGAAGTLVLSASSRTAILEAAGLSAAPDDKEYELWWISAQQVPLKAGLFRPQGGSEAVVFVSPPPAGEHVIGAAVTLEARGGASKPTGPTYLKSTPLR